MNDSTPYYLPELDRHNKPTGKYAGPFPLQQAGLIQIALEALSENEDLHYRSVTRMPQPPRIPMLLPPYDPHALQLTNHRIILTDTSVALVAANKQDDLEGLEASSYTSLFLQPKEAIAFARWILAQHDQLDKQQQALEHQWKAVAQEVCQLVEASGLTFAQATAQQIQHTLEVVAEIQTHPLSQAYEPRSPAGKWYRSLFDQEGWPLTFLQQWIPFLQICAQQQETFCPARFPGDCD